jgi:hypothetical protein
MNPDPIFPADFAKQVIRRGQREQFRRRASWVIVCCALLTLISMSLFRHELTPPVRVVAGSVRWLDDTWDMWGGTERVSEQHQAVKPIYVASRSLAD